jgi:gamma-glutamylcyclotransferase (GGCT)/AIG2-like uncharacterized protein YtfP
MNEEQIVRLFSYGTLRQESVQLATFGRLLSGTEDAMVGYKRSMIEITDPDVIAKSGMTLHPIVMESQDPTDEVWGMVFTMTATELAAADAYEVSDYRRIKVRLKSEVDAWVYIKA